MLCSGTAKAWTSWQKNSKRLLRYSLRNGSCSNSIIPKGGLAIEPAVSWHGARRRQEPLAWMHFGSTLAYCIMLFACCEITQHVLLSLLYTLRKCTECVNWSSWWIRTNISVLYYRERLGVDDIALILQQNRLRWYGHVLRKDDDDWAKKCVEYEVEGSRPRGRPKRTWKEVVREDCQARKVNKEDAVDRCKWRKVIKEVRWPGWVWAGECFFWYWRTRVDLDKRPLNGWLSMAPPHGIWHGASRKLNPALNHTHFCAR